MAGMKVLLAYRCHDEGVDDEVAETLPPGLPWACAALRAAGHDATVANFSRLGWKDVERHLREVSPDVFGACCLTANRKTAVRLIRLARRVRPEVVTTLGGPHALLSETLLAR